LEVFVFWKYWTWAYLKYLIPNLLSFLRMLAVLPIWWAMSQDDYSVAFWIYCAALLTDYLDGATARWFKAVSDIGKLLDPLADKVLHVFVLYQFQQLYPQLSVSFVFIVILAVVLASLPGIVTLFRVVRRLGANWFGKVKLCTEGAAIILLFTRHPGVAFWLLWLAVALAVGSIIGHLVLKEGKDYRWWLRWLLRWLLRLEERKT
jgi:CDP-diacylglycerol--glycerol-3-phosphate 3-phosphatidyltransferase